MEAKHIVYRAIISPLLANGVQQRVFRERTVDAMVVLCGSHRAHLGARHRPEA